tara:strand:- start:287 stop:556 length:270 start_codon:yes stop_codon:yes gene_type:complete
MSLGQIIEGWKNHLLPQEREKSFVKHVSNERLAICNECEHHSKNHKSIRIDAHCTECGCTLSAKTKCLTCECPLKKWMAQQMPEENDVT